MNELAYHVLLDGRKVGPYDRRTIVGMRVKKTLGNDHVLIGADGSRLTVGELIGDPRAVAQAQRVRSATGSLVQASYRARLAHGARGPLRLPAFQDEIEMRVQGDVLRVAGRFR